MTICKKVPFFANLTSLKCFSQCRERLQIHIKWMLVQKMVVKLQEQRGIFADLWETAAICRKAPHDDAPPSSPCFRPTVSRRLLHISAPSVLGFYCVSPTLGSVSSLLVSLSPPPLPPSISPSRCVPSLAVILLHATLSVSSHYHL